MRIRRAVLFLLRKWDAAQKRDDASFIEVLDRCCPSWRKGFHEE